MDTKIFEFVLEGAGVIRITVRSWKVMKYLQLGSVMVDWLALMVEESVQSGASKECFETISVGYSVYQAQRCSHSFSPYLIVAEYDSGGKRGRIVILDGVDRNG